VIERAERMPLQSVSAHKWIVDAKAGHSKTPVKS